MIPSDDGFLHLIDNLILAIMFMKQRAGIFSEDKS